jgi:hypothetical protein
MFDGAKGPGMTGRDTRGGAMAQKRISPDLLFLLLFIG